MESVEKNANAAPSGSSGLPQEELTRLLSLAASDTEKTLPVLMRLKPFFERLPGDQLCSLIDALPIPEPASAEERKVKLQLQHLFKAMWEPPFGRSDEICEVTVACINHFGSRFVGGDTFVYGDFVHTSLLLGSGSEGEVHLGFQISQQGRPVAIKKISKKELLRSEKFVKLLDQQNAFLLQKSHESIVQLYHVEKLESCIYCYFEFCDGGDLASFLNPRDPQHPSKAVNLILEEAKSKELFRKFMVPAVDHLRQNGVVHRDLKPANFMRTRSGEIKLVDFGTMRAGMDAGDLTSSVKGTPVYMAPEIWHKGTAYEGEKVDVWSLGVILYEMVCGRRPWNGQNIRQHVNNVRSQPVNIDPALGLSNELVDLITNMLKVRPEYRLSWKEVVDHDWLVEDPLSSYAVGNLLEEKAEKLEQEVVLLQTRCERLEKEQQQKDAIIASLSKELQEKKHDEVEPLQEQLRLANERAEANERTAETLTAKHESKEAQLKEKVLMSTRQVVQLQEQLAACQVQVEEQQALNTQLQNEAVEGKRVTEATLARVSQLNEECARLSHQRDEDVAQAEETLAAEQGRLATALSRVAQLEQEAETLAQEKEALISDVMGNLQRSGEFLDLQTELRDKRVAIENLENDLARAREEIQNLSEIMRNWDALRE